MSDIFLSYSRDDQAIARRFAEAFQREGLTVWWDQTLNAGEDYDEVTEKALEEAGAVVVLWSKKSVASRWVRAEATQADRGGTLVPAMIEPCKRPIMFELKQTAELSSWTGDPNDKAWQAYLASVRRLVEKGGPVASVSPVVKQSPLNSRSMAMSLGIAFVVLLVAVLIAWSVIRTHREQAAAPVTTVPSAPASITLAVLPFADMSPGHDQEYFSDGLSEELLNQLAQVKNLRVAGRSSSFSFKGKNEDLRAVAEKLGVNHLLEGSVRKVGSRLRITAQLINAKDGLELWSQSYDRDLDDVFAIQEEIATATVEALKITLGVGESFRVTGGTTNVIAYDKYLRARALWLGQTQFQRAVELFREAVAIDPQYGRAWYALWDALAWAPASATTPQERAEASARAVALAPDAWWSHAMRASYFGHQREWSKAEAEAEAAIAAQPPSEFEAGTMQAYVLLGVGRNKVGVQYFERARQMEPLSLGISSIVQRYYTNAGRVAEAEAEYLRSQTLAGDRRLSELTALVRLWQNRNADPAAVKAQFRVLSNLDAPPDPLNQAVLDNLSSKSAARAVIRKAFEDPANQDSYHLSLIALYADHFGDRDLALTALRRLIFELGGEIGSIWATWETGLRSDPRFKQIVRDLGLVDYWRTSGKWSDYCNPVGKDDFECH